jgi:hypothetical protein
MVSVLVFVEGLGLGFAFFALLAMEWYLIGFKTTKENPYEYPLNHLFVNYFFTMAQPTPKDRIIDRKRSRAAVVVATSFPFSSFGHMGVT